MIEFGQVLDSEATYKEFKHDFPTLQEKVFKVLRDLTPNAFGMELDIEHKERKFNQKYIDTDTHRIIVDVLRDRIDIKRLMLTNDDIYCAWSRFKELLFLFDGVSQGILEEKSGDDGGSIYVVKGLEQRPRQRKPIKTHFPAKEPVWYKGYSPMRRGK